MLDAQTDDRRRRLFDLGDLKNLVLVLASAVIVRIVPEARWDAWADRLARLGRLGAGPGRDRAATAKIAAFFPAGLPRGEAPRSLALRAAGQAIQETFAIRQLDRRPGWRPPHAVEGADRVGEALAAGGALLWVAPVPFAMTLSIIAAHDRGWPAYRLSHVWHGHGMTRFGAAVLSPHVRRVEDRFAQRIVFDRSETAAARERLREVLRGGGLAIVQARDIGRRLSHYPLLGGSIRLALGGPSAARKSGVPLFFATCMRGDRGVWRLRIRPAPAGWAERPLPDAGAALAAEIEATLRADPAQWRINDMQTQAVAATGGGATDGGAASASDHAKDGAP